MIYENQLYDCLLRALFSSNLNYLANIIEKCITRIKNGVHLKLVYDLFRPSVAYFMQPQNLHPIMLKWYFPR